VSGFLGWFGTKILGCFRLHKSKGIIKKIVFFADLNWQHCAEKMIIFGAEKKTKKKTLFLAPQKIWLLLKTMNALFEGL